MAGRRHRHWWIGLGGVTALTAGGALAQRRHLRTIAQDPEQAVLGDPPTGTPVGVRSKDGTQLHVELFGSTEGQPIVLAHGWTESLSYWAYEIRELTSQGYWIVAYDQRGHGQSEPASGGDYALQRFGEDLEAVLSECVFGQRRAVVAGHSLGAMSIAAWAEHHDVQRHAGAAVLLNTGVGDLIAEQLLIPVPTLAQMLNRLLPPTATLGSHAAVPRFSTPLSQGLIRYIAFGPGATPAQIAFYERMLVACPPDVRADVGIALSEMDLYHALPRLTVPTIVIAGAEDRLTPPWHAQRIAEALPNLKRTIVLDDTGHMGPLERPQEVSEVLAELAGEVAARTAGVAA